MKEEMGRFYLGNGALKIIPVIAALLTAGVIVISAVFGIRYRVYDVFPMLGITILLFVLSRVYFAHEKNVMKAALSAILSFLTAWEFYYLADWIGCLFLAGEPAADAYDWFSFIVRIVFCALFLSIMIRHFILTSEHRSNAKRIRMNTIMLMATVVVFAVSLAVDLVQFSGADPGKKWWGAELSLILSRLFEVTALVEVIGIEILLDMFRSRRERRQIGRENA